MRNYFKADEAKNAGYNWLLADFGDEFSDGKNYILTTNSVHASELHSIVPCVKEFCELIAKLLNWYCNTDAADDIIAGREPK